MVNYQEARVRLTNIQLNKLKSAAKNKSARILRLTKKNFEYEELLHQLLLTTRKTIKICNVISNDMSTDIKLSKDQISTIIQSSGSFGSWLGNLRKKALTNITIPLAGDNLPGLKCNLTSNAINKFEGKINGKGAVRAGKGFILSISNEDMNAIIKIIKSLKDSGVLIDGVTETVKNEIKKARRWISWSFVSTFSRFISATSNFFSSKRYK